jgi:dTDP-4-dehydrorhamnose 3,5-epimerase
MIFTETVLKGAFIIEPQRLEDERGFFARAFCEKEFRAHGLRERFVQCNISFNKKKGILRGMHYQIAPHAEAKVVRCTRGGIYSVIIDLRPDSKTYCRWISTELTGDNYKMLYVPEGFAAGYQTLRPGTEVFYLMSEFYAPTHERAVRWNDPLFAIKWPLPNPILSVKDQSHPDFKP